MKRKKVIEPDLTMSSDVQLVLIHNDLAESELGREVGAHAVIRFKDRDQAVAKIKMLLSSIRARISGLKKEKV